MPDEMENEFMKRGYLLPNGCKNLIDVLRLGRVRELVEADNRKRFRIIADLMRKNGFFAKRPAT